MEMLTAFLAALALAWTIGLAIGGHFSGYGKQKMPRWIPAALIADYIVNGMTAIPALTISSVCLVLIVIASFFQGIIGTIIFIIPLIILTPLPVCIANSIRHDSLQYGKEYLFSNPYQSPPKEQTKEEEDDDTNAPPHEQLIFYIQDHEWHDIHAFTQADFDFWQQYRVAPALYIAPMDNNTMLSFESLNLYTHIVSPAHQTFIKTITQVLKNQPHTSVLSNETPSELTEQQPLLNDTEPPLSSPTDFDPNAKRSAFQIQLGEGDSTS